MYVMFTPSRQRENELLHKLTHEALQVMTHTAWPKGMHDLKSDTDTNLHDPPSDVDHSRLLSKIGLSLNERKNQIFNSRIKI